jgi:Amt family ammonium transporter
MLDTGDTAFIIIAAALVMFMTPGLALFYGGLVRSKNVLSTMLQSFICLGMVSIIWVVYGYSIAFGPDIKELFGNLEYLFLQGVDAAAGPYSDTIPHLLFCGFQLMFAIITPALITGAFAERIKFSACLLFTFLWTTVVYLPVCHWVWGGGWIGEMGALDFAGGTVIHINSAVAAFVAAVMVGKRKGWGRDAFMPHNVSMTVLGAGILWVGWFGFNAGSALAANGIATVALFGTQVAAGAAAFSWMMTEWKMDGRPTALGAASGGVAGLVAITPAAGFVGPVAAVIIGLVGGVLCCLGLKLKTRYGYDDALDVVAVHGIGGLWGALATGLFASTRINPGGADGLFYGNPEQLWIQLVGAVVVIAFSLVVSTILFKLTDKLVGLRVSEEEEIQGLDITQHSEVGYTL